MGLCLGLLFCFIVSCVCFYAKTKLKSSCVISLDLGFVFFNIGLAFWVHLWFLTNVKIVCSTSGKKCYGNFNRDCIKYLDFFE